MIKHNHGPSTQTAPVAGTQELPHSPLSQTNGVSGVQRFNFGPPSGPHCDDTDATRKIMAKAFQTPKREISKEDATPNFSPDAISAQFTPNILY